MLFKLAPLAFLADIVAAPAAPSPQLVERWQRAAVEKHPALAKAGSPLNERFLAIIAAKRASEPGFFDQADWPMRAAEAAAAELKAAEAEAMKKQEAEMARTGEERARAEEIAEWEREWATAKERWIFDRLVFGDSEELIVRKLNLSKLVTPRAVAGGRAALNARFRWMLGESIFNIDFTMMNGLAAITFEPLPEDVADLGTLIRGDWEKLRAAAIEQLGPPGKSAEFPGAPQLQRGGMTVTDVWEKPGRHATLGISEDGGKCSATLRISDPARLAGR